MMRRQSAQLAALTLTGVVSLVAPAGVRAQNAETASGSASRGRSTNERTNTEAATPPPANSDYRRAAEGTLPAVPGGNLPIGTQPVPGGSIDPAVRPLPPLGTNVNAIPGTGMAAGLPPGMDVALMIEHAVDMSLDSSLLAAIAAANMPDDQGNDAVKALQNHASDEMKAAKDLLSKAAAAGNGIESASPVRGLYHAANNYMMTLGSLSEPGLMAAPNNKAEMAMINHAVKTAFDAGHIGHLGNGGPGAPGMAALLAHAQMMKDEATRTLDKIGGTNPIDPSSPPSPAILAQKGRELVAAANAVAPMASQMYGANPAGMNGAGGINGGLIPGGQGPNPGRFQANRPEIVGGTYGTGSQTAGTATGAEAARNVKNSTEGPGGVLNVPDSAAPGSGVSGYGVGNNNTPPTNSTAGSRPR